MTKIINIAFILLFSIPLTLFAENTQTEYTYQTGNYFDTDIAKRVLRRSFTAIPSDLYGIASAPFQNPAATLKYAGIIGGIIAFDRPITTLYQRHVEEPLDIYSLPTLFYRTSFTHGADSWLVYGILGHYLGGFALGDEKSQVTAIMAAKAMAYSVVFDQLLIKSLFGRRRPKNDLYHNTDANPTHTSDPHDFSPFQPFHIGAADGRTSLASFHLTMYFSMAKVYSEMYDNYWLPYGALALIFASNIKGHHHWVGDMVAGGIIGTLIGHQIVSNYHNRYDKKRESDFQIIPSGNGVGFSYRF